MSKLIPGTTQGLPLSKVALPWRLRAGVGVPATRRVSHDFEAGPCTRVFRMLRLAAMAGLRLRPPLPLLPDVAFGAVCCAGFIK